ncbi:MAG: membrane protein insertion efficiency factor YidD [Thermodesulfobacteriota bacterium]
MALPLMWAVRLFQTTVSRVDGPRCPSYPTCSAYAVEALREHGPVLGIALTAGRLLSDADEAAFSPRIFVGGRWRVYAPVEDDLAFLRGRLDP